MIEFFYTCDDADIIPRLTISRPGCDCCGTRTWIVTVGWLWWGTALIFGNLEEAQ